MTRRRTPTPSPPLRGEIWDARFPAPVGPHPVVVLTSNALVPRLSALTCAVVTSTEGPATTHVPVDPDSGVGRRRPSWINATDLHAVPVSRLVRRRGRLAPDELARLEAAVRAVLAL